MHEERTLVGLTSLRSDVRPVSHDRPSSKMSYQSKAAASAVTATVPTVFLTPRLIAQESIIFLSLTLSVCMYVSPSVCHRAPANRFLFFVSQWNRAIFGPCVWHSTKRCSSIFDLGPLTPKIYSPKFALWVIEPVDSRSLWVMVCGSKKVGLGAESPYAYRLVDI